MCQEEEGERLSGRAHVPNIAPTTSSARSSRPEVDHLQDLEGKLRRPGVCTWERPSPPGTGSWALPDLVLGHEVHALGRSGAERFLRHGGSGLRALVLTNSGLSVSRRQGDRLPSNVGRGGGGGAAPGAGWGRFLVPAARLCPPLSPSPSLLSTCMAPAAAVPSCAGNPGKPQYLTPPSL